MSRGLSFAAPFLLLAWLGSPRQETVIVSPDLSQLFVEMTQGGRPLRIALPAFEPRSPAAAETAAELTRVLRADIEFASVYRIVDEKLYPVSRTDDGRFDYPVWDRANVDVVVSGQAAIEAGGNILSQVRIHAVREGVVAFGTEYRAPADSARRLAHRIADEILQKSGLVGVAQTKIAFAGDRGGEKGLYRMDYDGGRQERLAKGFLDLAPRWSPDGESLLFVSFPRRSAPPVLAVVSNERRSQLFASDGMLFPASWSPDGKKVAFSSTRDGNAEIYVMNADGTHMTRLTDHPGIDVSPTWSPTGKELAFTSDRTGSPQIYIMDQEGLNLRRVSPRGSYNAEPAWSPSLEVSEIAYASRIEGAVFDVVVQDLLTNQIRQLTSQRGLNESPSWAPNGRHLVFTSTRTGDSQLFTVNRDSSKLRQITFEGSSRTPGWGPVPRF